jgi:hypothetical protein
MNSARPGRSQTRVRSPRRLAVDTPSETMRLLRFCKSRGVNRQSAAAAVHVPSDIAMPAMNAAMSKIETPTLRLIVSVQIMPSI